ncbi:hypothetical protein PHISP_04765 [Aspergillus sp. HF37]|nr:hypothetical protein PHISP_04765 [Aspergillus sp. HF37]
MPGVPPDTFRQLKERVKNVFRRMNAKRTSPKPDSDSAVIVDPPVDAAAVVSGAVPAPAPVAEPPSSRPAQNSNSATSRHDSAAASDSDSEADIPAAKPKVAAPKAARARTAATSDPEGPIIPPPLPA